MNLPMVVPPVPWGGLRENAHLDEKHPPSIFDCSGGSQPGGEFLNRFRLITSKEYEKNSYIKWNGYEAFSKMCSFIKTLKNKEFRVNTDMFTYFYQNRDVLASAGLLMPRYLKDLSGRPHAVYDMLRVELSKDENKNLKFSQLVDILEKGSNKHGMKNWLSD